MAVAGPGGSTLTGLADTTTTPVQASTGYHLHRFIAPLPGTYTITIGVCNEQDTDTQSIVHVDLLKVTELLDADDDGFIDTVDNCPGVRNPGQDDTDGIGNTRDAGPANPADDGGLACGGLPWPLALAFAYLARRR